MTEKYRPTLPRKLVNLVRRHLTRLGIGGRYAYVLTVRGRKTGRAYSTPVKLIEYDSGRWLVAPYGEVNWVRNARSAGEVTLSRGGEEETLAIVEVGAEESAPVLREYLRAVPLVKGYFDATPDSPLEDFAAESSRHPVFRLVEA
jgi:deazaflavin-dependent oxidoreductase (nitroreductase family)